MIRFALKNLLQERLRLAVSAGSVAVALFLVLLLEGVVAGASEQMVSYLEHSGAEAWVMQPGVSNMHMSASTLPLSTVKSVASAPGVRRATPILYANHSVEAGGRRWLSYVVGLPPGAKQGGPWEMEAGADLPGPGEVVLPSILARKAGVSIGDRVSILGRDFRVVGLSLGTYSMANSVTFVSYQDMQGLLGSSGVVSYVLVEGDPGVSKAALARSIAASVPGVNVMTMDAFVASDRQLASQMGVDLIRIMSIIGFAVGVLVIALTVYTATVKRAREYGVAKALGASNLSLLGVVAMQTIGIGAAGIVFAVAGSYAVKPLIEYLVPEVPLAYAVGSLVRVSIIGLSVAALAALIPAFRMARVEPMVVSKE